MPVAWRMAVTTLVPPFLFFSGCASDTMEVPSQAGPFSGDSEGDPENLSVGSGTAAPALRRLFLAPDYRLDESKPEDSTLPLRGNALDCLRQVPSCVDHYESEPFPAPGLLKNVSITVVLWLETEALIASADSSGDVWAFFGTSRGIFESGLAGFEDPAYIDGTIRIEFTLDQERQLDHLVLTGDEVVLLIGSGSFREPSALRVLLGGERASYVEFTFQNLTAEPRSARGPFEETLYSGNILGFGIGIGTPIGIVTPLPFMTQFEIPREPDLEYLEVRVRQVDGNAANPARLLLTLRDENRYLVRGAAPAPEQGLVLGGPPLEEVQSPTLQVRVYVSHGADTSFELTVLKGFAG